MICGRSVIRGFRARKRHFRRPNRAGRGVLNGLDGFGLQNGVFPHGVRPHPYPIGRSSSRSLCSPQGGECGIEPSGIVGNDKHFSAGLERTVERQSSDVYVGTDDHLGRPLRDSIPFMAYFPALKCWAILNCPFGTEGSLKTYKAGGSDRSAEADHRNPSSKIMEHLRI